MSGAPVTRSDALPTAIESAGSRPRALALRRAEEIALLVFAGAISLSIAASEIAFLSSLALRVARARSGDPWALRPRGVLWATLALAVSWSVSAAFSPEPLSSFLRVHRLYQVLVVFLVCEHASRPRGALRLATAYFVGAALGATYGLLTWLPAALSGLPELRLEGAFSTAMTSGNVLATAFAAVAVFSPWFRGGPRAASGAAALPVILALAATRTRSSWIGALAGGATALVLGRARAWALFVLVLAVVAAALVPDLRARGASVVDPTDYTAQGRISLWRTGWDVFRERPILGWGLADHGELIRAHRRADATFVAGHFHNNLVHVAVAGGAVGLLAYLVLQASLAWPAWKRRQRSLWGVAALSVWVSFQLAGLFDWSFGDAEVAYQFFFWMGLGAADNEEAGDGVLVDPSRRPC